MKKLFLLAVAALALGMSSCSDNGQLTASSAKKAIGKEVIFDKNFDVVNFNTGYREVWDGDLQVLAKLQAAGVITFSVDTVVEHTTGTRWEYWYGYVSYPIERTHYFAQVDLTKQGEKYIVEKPATIDTKLDDELLANLELNEEMPEYMQAVYRVDAPAEAVEEVVTEVIEEAPELADTVLAVATEVAEEIAPAVEEVTVEEAPAAPEKDNSAFEAAQARCSTESHFMLKGRWQLVSVKDVKCTQQMYEEGKGSCRYFAKYADKTPFGFVFGAPANGFVTAGEATFTLYQDSGWTIENINF